jgi:hypothetical protein
VPLEIFRNPGESFFTEDTNGDRYDIEVTQVTKDEVVHLALTDPDGNKSTLTVPTKPPVVAGRMGFTVAVMSERSSPRWRGAVRFTARGPNEVRIMRSELEGTDP